MKKAKRTEHGMSGHRLNKIWRMMRQRCYNPKDSAFKNYGGRGIRICEEWDTFEVFMNWALSNGYADGLTVDRLDVDGNYEPGNCEWVTRGENARRARTGKPGNNLGEPIEFNGKSQYLREWSDELGIGYQTLYKRLNKSKMSVEAAFTTKVKGRG